MLDQGAEIKLIHSKYFVLDSSFNVKNVLVLNDEGDKVSSVVFDVIYDKYDKKNKLGGDVSIVYKGTTLLLDGKETVKVVLTGRSEEVNIVAGASLALGLSTAGGDDFVTIQKGAEVNGNITMGTGDDELCLEVGVVVNSNTVNLGTGDNTLTVHNYAMLTGTVVFENGTIDEGVNNTIMVNGGAVDAFSGGNSYTTNTITFNGTIDYNYEITYDNGDRNAEFEASFGGGVGTWTEVAVQTDYYTTITNHYFVAQTLNLGDSNDTVIFNAYASVNNINLGGGDDKLILNENADIDGDIDLGSGTNTLVLTCGGVFDNRLIDNKDGTNVIVAAANMSLDGNKLGLGSTNNVLVLGNGVTVEFDGEASGLFSKNDITYEDVYLSQNAVISFEDFSGDTQYIQNYSGYLAAENDLVIMAAPTGAIPAQISEYYQPGVTGVVKSDIGVDGDLFVEAGATILNSNIEVGIGGTGNAYIDGTITGGTLVVADDLYLDGILDGSLLGAVPLNVYVDGDMDIDGTVIGGNIDVDGIAWINGSVGTTSSNTTLTAEDAIFDAQGASFIGSLTAEYAIFNAEDVNFIGTLTVEGVMFNYDFTSPDLVISTEEVILDENVLATVSVLTNIRDQVEEEIEYYMGDNSALIELGKIMEYGVGLVTVGDISAQADPDGYVFDFGIFDVPNISLRGVVDADIRLTDNTVYFDGGYSHGGDQLHGMVELNGDNIFVINTDSFFDWQQFQLVDTATLGFDISEGRLVAIDGFIPSADATVENVILPNTDFELNSQLVVGNTAYIHDWKDTVWDRMYDLTETQEEVNEFTNDISAPNLALANLYVTRNATIWGGISLNNEANNLVVKGGVVVNGGVNYYDYGTIQTLAGDDTVTIGELGATFGATFDDLRTVINGQINTGATMTEDAVADGITYTNDDDKLTLVNTDVNTAVNQGIPAISMGWGDDELNIIGGSSVNGDISLGGGDDTANIMNSTVNGTIDLGYGNDELTISSSLVGITFGTGTDDAIVGGTGENAVTVSSSVVNGDIELGGSRNVLDVSGTTLTGEITLADGENEISLIESSFSGEITLGDGFSGTENYAYVDTSTLGGDLNLGGISATVLVMPEHSDSNRVGNFALLADSTGKDINFEDVAINGTVVSDDDLRIGNTATIARSTIGDINFDDVSVNGMITMDQASLSIASIAMISSSAVGDILFGDVTLNSPISIDDLTGGTVFFGNIAATRSSTLGNVIFEDFTANTGVNISINNFVDGRIAIGNIADITGSTLTGDLIFDDFDIGAVDITGTINDSEVKIGNIARLDDSVISGTVVYGEVTFPDTGSIVVGGDFEYEFGNIAEIYNNVRVMGDLVMMGDNTDVPTFYSNDIQFDEIASLTVDQSIVMTGINEISALDYDTEEEALLDTGIISNTLTAQGISMNGLDNHIQFGVQAEADSEYAPGLYRPTSLQFAAITMTLTAPIIISNSATNVGAENKINMALSLTAEGYSAVEIVGDVNISLNSSVSMTGERNEIKFGFDATAFNTNFPGLELYGNADIRLNDVSLTFNSSEIRMLNNGSDYAINTVDMKLNLAAHGESTITAGDVSIALNDESMLSLTGVNNLVALDVFIAAVNQNPNLVGEALVSIDAVNITLNADVLMVNDVIGVPAVNQLIMDFQSMALGHSSIVVGPVDVNFNGSVIIVGEANRVIYGIKVGADGEYLNTGSTLSYNLYENASITLDTVSTTYNTPISMGNNVSGEGADNFLEVNYYLNAGAEGNINATEEVDISINGDIRMIGKANYILFTSDVEVNGALSTGDTFTGEHKESRIQIGAIDMGIVGDINMSNDISDTGTVTNILDMDYTLGATGEGDIAAYGDGFIGITGDINMLGNDNHLSAQIRFEAGLQSVINLNGNDVSLLIDGDVTMTTLGDASNTIELGYSFEPLEPAVPVDPEEGVVGATGTYEVEVTGNILMAGIGATNTLTIERNVTIGGGITIGTIIGDQLSAYNALTLNDPGSFEIDGSIVLTAEANGVTFNGEGNVRGLVSIYGGTNELFVGEGVTLGVTAGQEVSFGGIYDADHIGIEGYQIIANTANTIEVYGNVFGINTSVDLNGPTGMVNSSDDDIDIFGTVTQNIITGNSTTHDDIDIHGGQVGGYITMGTTADVGTNSLFIQSLADIEDPALGYAAGVAGNVVMETTAGSSLAAGNTLTMQGYVNYDLSDMTAPEAVYRASIGGNVFMSAEGFTGVSADILRTDVGSNVMILGAGLTQGATTIGGDVVMNAGISNYVNVDTGWNYQYDMATSAPGSTYDAASYVKSFDMASQDNLISVDGGTFVITATTGNGIAMTQDNIARGATFSGGDNMFDVDDTARLVSTSDILMGNTMDALTSAGVYTYSFCTPDPNVLAGLETYHFVWNNAVTGVTFDTNENDIIVNGKMSASDVVMYGTDNNIELDGPAVPPVGVTQQAATIHFDNVAMNGLYNEITVEGNTAGDAEFTSGTILMNLGIGVSGAAIQNRITNDDDYETLFNSEDITMIATNSNELKIYGMVNGVVVTNSSIDGNVLMLAGPTAGFNDAVFDLTDITGDVGMNAGTFNAAKITASTVTGSISQTAGTFNFLGIDPSTVTGNVSMDSALGGGISGYGDVGNMLWLQGATAGTGITGNVDVTLSRIGGNVTMDANSGLAAGATGWNVLMVNMGGITGSVSMTSVVGVTGGNYLDLNGVTGHSGLSDTVVESFIGGLVMDNRGITAGATGGFNSVDIDLGNVNGSISMFASGSGATFIAGNTYTFGTNLLEVSGGVVAGVTYYSDITGGVSMTALLGNNSIGFTMATVGAGITMNSVTNWNSANIVDSNISGGIYQTGGQGNILHIDPSTITGGVVMTSIFDNNILDIAGAGASLSSIAGGVNMSTVTGDNELELISFASISGGVIMTNTGSFGQIGDSYLDVYNTTSIAGGVTFGIGDDALSVYGGATLTGTINMGAGTNFFDLDNAGGGTTFAFDTINTGGVTGASVIISGTAQIENLFISSGFGSAGSTMTVGSQVDTLTFNTANTVVDGNLDTDAMVAGANVLNAANIANTGTLINASGLTSWDILSTVSGGAGDLALVGNDAFTAGQSVTLVSTFAVDISAWTTHSAITLTLATSGNISLAWDGGVLDTYSGTNGTETWRLTGDNTSGTGLNLARIS
jgi:hypothetical protein